MHVVCCFLVSFGDGYDLVGLPEKLQSFSLEFVDPKCSSTKMQWKWEKLVQQVLQVESAESWAEPAVLCPFQPLDCWNVLWFVPGTTSPANKTQSWWKCLTTFGTVFDLCAHTASLFSAVQVWTDPKSSQIPSSCALLSWCGSARLHLI